ncbi:MAG: hypothetical protein A3H71_00605 [Candidatus Sungbacteria bacterium RIFCSPLOWO2_02_FULL_48_13b]|uniref:Uncharacterized protein n=1 Tax=Candidatus Sungbacteria bacterium RIFCSPLOWO2_02_FULL_48_13b TaxID=1802283 RepID=A0A1G2LEL4_9BACT|nr:MAG: hypothetical protein A3H71_00605 [Candidatus Sungbacteria bacterium RIFCSPLOWO2_02_FULL_48_13b]
MISASDTFPRPRKSVVKRLRMTQIQRADGCSVLLKLKMLKKRPRRVDVLGGVGNSWELREPLAG